MIRFKYERMLSGWLIGYYRRQLHLSQEDLLTYLSASQVSCSLKTLGRLEHGHVVNDERIYHLLAKALHRSDRLDVHLLQRLHKYRLDLQRYLIQYSKSGMKRLLSVITHELAYQKSLYISEMLQIYQQLLLYELYHQSPDEKCLQIVSFLKDKVNKDDQRLLFFLLHHNFYVLNEINIHSFDPLFFDIDLDQLCSSANVLHTYHQLLAIQCDPALSLSTYQHILLLQHLAQLNLRDHDPQSASDAIKKAIQLYRRDFCDPLLAILYAEMGYICYQLNQYDASIEYFMTSMQINPFCIDHHLLLFFHAYELINRTHELKKLLARFDTSIFQNSQMHAIFDYYQIKYHHSSTKENRQTMENYLCYHFKELYSIPYYATVLLDELHELCQQTNNYKSLYHILTFLSHQK